MSPTCKSPPHLHRLTAQPTTAVTPCTILLGAIAAHEAEYSLPDARKDLLRETAHGLAHGVETSPEATCNRLRTLAATTIVQSERRIWHAARQVLAAQGSAAARTTTEGALQSGCKEPDTGESHRMGVQDGRRKRKTRG